MLWLHLQYELPLQVNSAIPNMLLPPPDHCSQSKVVDWLQWSDMECTMSPEGGASLRGLLEIREHSFSYLRVSQPLLPQ